MGKGQSPAAYSRQHLSPDSCYRLCINRQCCGPCFNWLESVWSCVSLYDAPVFVPELPRTFGSGSSGHVPGSKFTKTSSIEGRVEAGGGEPDGTPSGQRDGRLGIACQQAAGTGLGPPAEGQGPAPGATYVRAAGKVEVHRVAEVAAFGSAVHRELVHRPS